MVGGGGGGDIQLVFLSSNPRVNKHTYEWYMMMMMWSLMSSDVS